MEAFSTKARHKSIMAMNTTALNLAEEKGDLSIIGTDRAYTNRGG